VWVTLVECFASIKIYKASKKKEKKKYYFEFKTQKKCVADLVTAELE